MGGFSLEVWVKAKNVVRVKLRSGIRGGIRCKERAEVGTGVEQEKRQRKG